MLVRNNTFDIIKDKVSAIKSTENSYYIHNMFEVGYHRLTDADNYSEYGLSCAGTRLGFPGSFLVQYRENHPDGAEKVLYDKYYDWFDTSIRRKNHDKRSSQALFIRDFEGMHYGVLTDKYAMFDDDEVVDILSQNEYLMSSKEFWSDITPERFHARFVDAEKLYIPGDSSPLSLCTFVDNSMVGKSSFKIRFGIYRWACTNGMIAGLKEFEILKMMHKGDKDYVQCVSEALENVEEYKKMLFEMVKEAACTYSSIYNLTEDQALAYIQKKLNVSKKASVIILENYRKYGNETKWDLTNAITDYAHVVDISSRIKLESAAFKIA